MGHYKDYRHFCDACGDYYLAQSTTYGCPVCLAEAKRLGFAFLDDYLGSKAREAVGLPPARPATRECLNCGRMFHSRDINHRICPACADTNRKATKACFV